MKRKGSKSVGRGKNVTHWVVPKTSLLGKEQTNEYFIQRKRETATKLDPKQKKKSARQTLSAKKFELSHCFLTAGHFYY